VTTPEPAIEDLAFDAALAELQRTVAELEAGGQPLEAAIALYERGVALKRHCENKLKEAQVKIEQITVGENTIGTTGFGG